MIVEILSVGTEILLGNIVNTNAQYLSERFAALGFSIYYQSVVGDNPERLEKTLKFALDRSDIVITTGGLGPTKDDLTKEIIAKTMGKELVPSAEARARIEEIMFKINVNIPHTNYKQSLVPQDSIVLMNNNGTAPGVIISENGKTVIMLPGPPNEMIPMFEDSVVPYIKKLSDETIFSVTVKMLGIGESAAAEMVDDLIENSLNPTVAPYAKTGECHLRVTAKAENENKALELINPVVDIIKNRLGEYIYTIDEKEFLEDVVVKILKEKDLKISFAESCTGGMLASRIVNVSGSSNILNESYITYSNEAKHRILGVSEETLKEYGAVSEQTVVEMAKGCAEISGSDVTVSVSGIAGPDGGTEEKPVGLVYICVYYNGKTFVSKNNFSGTRQKVREYSVMRALNMVRKILK